MPRIIPVPEAVEQHVNYLLGTKHVLINGQIVHSLYMEKSDLETMHKMGVDGGVRLYFCIDKKEISGTMHEYISIITVPLDENGENVLTNATGNSVVANNFSPCPDLCPTNAFSRNDLNYFNDGTIDAWCKPNESGTGWVDVNGDPVNVIWP